MIKCLFSSIFASLSLSFLCATAVGANPILGEIRLEPDSRTERDAGVWVDGQYLGFVKELDGRERLMLTPGPHEVRVNLAGFEEIVSRITVRQGETRRFKVQLSPLESASYPDAAQTASVRVLVEPERAALYVDGVYAGNVARFSGRNGVRLRAGTHRIRIELPGYQPFESEITLIANQRYEIKTELVEGQMADRSEEVAARTD